MKKNEFRIPLLQSGALLIAFLLFFSFVISSGASGIGSGLIAIGTGIFYSILFLIGLFLSILFSVSTLIVLFLAATAVYSVDKAKDIWIGIYTQLIDFIALSKDFILRGIKNSPRFYPDHSTKIQELEIELARLSEQNRQLQNLVKELSEQLYKGKS